MADPAKSALILGAHFSIAKGLHKAFDEAVKYQCNALQIFTKNASTWKERTVSDAEIKAFEKAMAETGIRHVAAHTSYLINIAGNDPEKTAMSADALKNELIRCDQLGIPVLVLHPGSHLGDGEAVGIRRIADAVNKIFDAVPQVKTRLLLETTAGQGSNLGYTFEQIAAMMEEIDDKSRIGVCIDTCHIFAAGYDLTTKAAYRKTFDAFDAVIGLSRLYLIHVNDAKKGCGSRVDRHEHIGDGEIGLDGFACLVNDEKLAAIPKILETPKKKDGKDADSINLKRLRTLRQKG